VSRVREVVALVMDEHLRLMGEPAKGGGMDDPVAIALETACGSAKSPRDGVCPAKRPGSAA
jgi:hypothetical protein